MAEAWLHSHPLHALCWREDGEGDTLGVLSHRKINCVDAEKHPSLILRTVSACQECKSILDCGSSCGKVSGVEAADVDVGASGPAYVCAGARAGHSTCQSLGSPVAVG